MFLTRVCATARPPFLELLSGCQFRTVPEGHYTHAASADNEGLQEHDEEAINFEENCQRANDSEDESPGGVFLGSRGRSVASCMHLGYLGIPYCNQLRNP
jgi:hypothetical protein